MLLPVCLWVAGCAVASALVVMTCDIAHSGADALLLACLYEGMQNYKAPSLLFLLLLF